MSEMNGQRPKGKGKKIVIWALIISVVLALFIGIVILASTLFFGGGAVVASLIWSVATSFDSGVQTMVDVPSLKGKVYAELDTYDGLTIQLGEEVYDENYAVGEIVSQDVPARTKVKKGTVITVDVSLGPQIIVQTYYMPDLVGGTKSRAEKSLAELKETLNLTITFKEIASDKNKKDIVLESKPIAESQLKEGDEIIIYVGNGVPDPEEVMMPLLVGKTLETAKQTLADLGFPQPKVIIVESTEAEGTVLGQSVPHGTIVLNSTVIELEVAGTPDQDPSGPVSVAMPLLVGKTLEIAKQTLADLGFPEPVVTEVYNSQAAGTVLNQNPGSNGLVSTETVVVLEVSKGPKPVETTPPTTEPAPEEELNIYTQFGLLTEYDVAIRVGETLYLYLGDGSGNRISVDWTCNTNEFISVTANAIKGLKSAGSAPITVRAEYEGKTYTCVIRVM